MTGLAVTAGPAPDRPDAGSLLRTGPCLTRRGTHWSVAVGGDDASVSVADDLVVAVVGRVPASRHPGAVEDGAAARLAAGLRREGEAALTGLCDDAVAVVVDPRAGSATAFRDVGGAVPLYLHGGRDGFVATTDLAGLVAGPLPLTVDERWAGAFVAGAWPDAGVSPYAEVVLLAPGEAGRARGSGWSRRRVDRLTFATDVPAGLAESAERLRWLLDAAVGRRLSGAGATAVTLSGGLDSSSVLACARAVAPAADLVALCLAFDDAAGDERDYQRLVAERAGVRQVVVTAGGLAGPFGREPGDVYARYGAPPLSGNWFLHAGLLDAARSAGVRRVLDGEDGDGVVGVRPAYLADVLANRGPVATAREIRAVRRHRGTPVQRLLRTLVTESARSARGRTWGSAEVRQAQRLPTGGYLSCLAADTHGQWQRLPGGAAHPFLDRAVMEYALALPVGHRVAGGVTKLALRGALGDRLPPEVATRRDKATLESPFNAAVLGPQHAVLQDGLAVARRTSPDISAVPVIDAATSRPGTLFRAYRVATTALWRQWLAERERLAPRTR